MGGFVLLVVASVGCSIGLNRILAAVELRRTCRKLREARMILASDVGELVALPASDALDRMRLDASPTNAELAAAGYVHLGDVREHPGEGVHRCFVSPDRRIIIHFSASNASDVVAESATASGVLITRRGGPGYFAMPPTHQHQWLAKPLGTRETIAQHERWLLHLRAMTTDPPQLLEIGTLEQVIEQARLQQSRIRTWRNSHDDDTLLELDLRGLLQASYDTRGPRFRRHLVAKPPSAKVRPPRTKS